MRNKAELLCGIFVTENRPLSRYKRVYYMYKRLDKINKKAEIANQAFWDAIAPVHYKSYDIEKLKQGKSLIDVIQKKEM